VAVPAILALIWVGGAAFLAFMGAVAVMGFLEISDLAGRKGDRIPRPLCACLVALILLGAFWGREIGTFLAATVSVIVILSVRLSRDVQSAIRESGVAVLGVLYTGGLASFAVLLREYPGDFWGIDPRYLTIFLFASVWGADTFSYFIGSAFGRRRILPRVSPRKSFEGAFGGVLGSVAVALGLGALWGGPAIHFMALGLIVAASDQLGDLVESMFKRDAEVKDTSGVIPGHGGVLDRFDGFLFTAPIVYIYLLYLSGRG